MATRRPSSAAARRGCLILLVLFALAAPSHASCTLTAQEGTLVAEGSVSLAWRTVPAAVRVGEPFELVIATCPTGAELLRVDARMPEHRHGMNYRPTWQRLADGRWRVQGLLWHMAGRWEWRFELRAGEAVHHLHSSVNLR